jgi:hypothetical protein
MNRQPHRRAFMKTLGAAACAMPFARMLYGSVAQAQSTPPRRLLILMSPHGTIMDNWRPRPNGTGGFTLDYPGSMLGPLEPYKHKMVLLDGIDYRVLYESGKTGHDGGPCTFLTGTVPVQREGTLYPTGPSVDQVIAKHIGDATPRPSLELGVFREGGTHVSNSINYTDGGNRLPSLIDPAVVYSRLFGGVVFAGTGSDATRALARKRSVLGYLKGEVGNLQGRLAGTERIKLQQHFDALHAIETRLTREQDVLRACDSPVAPGMLAPKAEANIPAIIDTQFDLITQAFACDLTRVVTFQFLQGGDPTPMRWVTEADLDTNIHDNVAHAVGPNALEANQKLIAVQRWYAKKVFELFERLDSVNDDAGGTLLDNTVILWGNELGDPSAHSSLNVPMILAGGGGGAFETGRHLQFSTSPDPLCTGIYGNCPADQPYRDQSPHNRVLVSLCQMFGIETDVFGSPDHTGVLPGLV